jgi:hypothetical protein
MQVLERYFEALRARDWEALAACLAEGVERSGPFCDVVRGRRAYVEFLARVLPTLENHALRISRLRALDGGSAVVELCEAVDVDGVPTEYPEAIFFDFDADGRILRVDVYFKQPGPVNPARPARPARG